MKFLKILISFLLILIISVYIYIETNLKTHIKIENITTTSDIDNDWINDIDDILDWSRKEVNNKTNYKSVYYDWWYPPQNEWVCTDLVRRAFKNAWINIKKLVDEDIQNNVHLYKRINWKPDPNIDFRRVPNLNTFFSRKAISLTTEIQPRNIENLKNWQVWDIVVFGKPKDHIAILSNKRNINWVPYIMHNAAPIPKEEDLLIYWHKNISKIIWHYRWKY